MADREERGSSKSLGSRLRGALGAARKTGAASLRVAQRTVSGGVVGAGERLKSGQAAVGHAVEARRIVKEAQEAQERGNHALAFRVLEESLAEHAADPKYVLSLWAAAIACEQTEDVVPAMRKLVRSLTGTGKLLRAAEVWMELRAGAAGALVDPGSLVRMAPALVEDGQQERAIEALREALDPDNVALSPGLAMRVVEMARDLDPRVALSAARFALENPDLNAAKRQKLQTLSAELEAAAAKAPAAKPEPTAQESSGTPASAPPAVDAAAAGSPAPAAEAESVADIPDLDAEGLAREIGAPTVSAAEGGVDETVSQRFVDLGEGEDLDLDLGIPEEPGYEDSAIGNEEFVELSEDAPPAAPERAVEAALAVESLEAPASAPSPEPELALDPERGELTPDAASGTAGEDDPFDVGGLDLGTGSDADEAGLDLPEGELLGASDSDLELTAPDAVKRDLAEETLFDAGGAGHLAVEALSGETRAVSDEIRGPGVEAVGLDAEELAALDDGDAPLLDELEAQAPALESAEDADPFATPDAFELPEVQAELTGEVLAEDPSALDDIATLVVEDAVEVLAPAARFAEVKVMDGAPKELSDVGVVLDLPGGRRGRVEYEKIEALAVAEVRGLAPHPVVLIDLLMNWKGSGDVALRVVRMRSDGFDPRQLVPTEKRAAAAFRGFLALLLERSGAVPLPDADLRPQPFDDLASYEREVLGVGE